MRRDRSSGCATSIDRWGVPKLRCGGGRRLGAVEFTRWSFESPNRPRQTNGFRGTEALHHLPFSHSAFPKMHSCRAQSRPPHRLVIKAGQAEATGKTCIPGIVSGACPARCIGQANRRHRCRLGVDPSVPDNGGIHGDLGRVAKLPRIQRLTHRWFLPDCSLAVLCCRTVEASNSLIANANLIGGVYFPRLIVPSDGRCCVHRFSGQLLIWSE